MGIRDEVKLKQLKDKYTTPQGKWTMVTMMRKVEKSKVFW